MRTIKFRFWEKPDTSVNFEGKMHYDSDEYFNKWCNHPDYETMQFTGLLDKHSKEIYEGDINTDDDNRKSEVVFYAGGFYLKYNKTEYEHIGSFAPFNLNIIGNIYENPELLTPCHLNP
jgi:hypothetical protein